jgi:hypothetical protein
MLTATLESLARSRFLDPPLTAAEIELVRNAPNGDVAVCGPNANNDDPLNDPSKADDDWKENRSIRAALIRWICVDRQAREFVDPRGIRIYGARISEGLDLSYAKVPFGLALRHCRLNSQTDLRFVEIAELDFQGSGVDSIVAGGANVKGSVLFREGFHSAGEVLLEGAEIEGPLDCSRAKFENQWQARVTGSGTALNADGAIIEGDVLLNKGFSARGEVRFIEAQIGGELNCSGGHFENQERSGVAESGGALTLDRAVVKGSIFLIEGFSAEGKVRLHGTEIGSNLECSGATFGNQGDTALSADGAVVKKDVFFDNGFRADGDVSLSGIQIGGDLVCGAAIFLGTVSAERASLKGLLFWRNISDSSRVGLDLIDASVDALVDDPESWPKPGRLELDGFVYRRFSGNAPTDAKSRLNWLSRQEPLKPQPYRQLATVLRNEGDDVGARHVLFEMESRRRDHEDRKPISRPHAVIAKLLAVKSLHRILNPVIRSYRPFWSWTLRKTIGYGYHPVWALWWLLGLTLLGSTFYLGGYSIGSMVPTDKIAYCAFKQDRQLLPRYYEHFHASMYSLENSFPLVKLGQVDHWQPDPSPQHFAVRIWRWPSSFAVWISIAAFLRWFRWFQILLGWVLATLFVAGVTGIVRRD